MDDAEKILFRAAVGEIVALIPCGRATSYGAIARAAGYPAHSRLVGRCVAGMESGGGLPAHRVVGSDGFLSGRRAFGPGVEQAAMLEAEGVEVAGDRIRNWKRVFWDPIEEINP